MTQKVTNLPFRGFATYVADSQPNLFQFNFSAGFFELSLEAFSVSLGETFLDYAGSAVNEFLSFLEAETGELLHELNDLELFIAGSLEDYVERGLLFSGCTGSCGACCNCNSSSGGFNAIFLFEDLSEFVNFLNGEVYKLFSKSF